MDQNGDCCLSVGETNSLDTALDLLANKYRRRLLIALMEQQRGTGADPPVPVHEAVGDENLEDLILALTHTHLPKLERAGVVEWNREERTVRTGPWFEEVRPLLELFHDNAEDLLDGWL